MQLSLVDFVPEFEKKYFIDVFAEAIFDQTQKRMKLKTIDGQQVPCEISVACRGQYLNKFPEGTIYKVDTKLVRKYGKKPYFVAINQKKVNRAIEFFDYNLRVQSLRVN